MDIDVKVKELTTYDIGDDGKSVTLRLTDVDGTRVSLSFQIPDLGNLAMTLPSLIEAALRRQYRDGSFRFAYPTDTWSVEEASDPSRLILTLRTSDGFACEFRHDARLCEAARELAARRLRHADTHVAHEH